MSAHSAIPVRQSTIVGLIADAPDPVQKENLMLFGQFVGDWTIEAQYFLPDGSKPRGKGEVHFGWILNGTAIQDVWTGRIEDPPPGFPQLSFGTTVRFYDPKLEGWQCVWVSATGKYMQMLVARQMGDEIILVSKTKEGFPERWVYSDITPNAFTWRALESHDGEQTWILTEEMAVRRIQSEG